MNELETPQSRCLAGVARCDITPPVGIYHRMWGAASHERSTGVHRPLTATVLYLQSQLNESSLPQVVIAVDHCLLWAKEMKGLLDTISSSTGVDRSALIVFFSHTHGAGLMGLERRDLPGGELIEPYLVELGQKISKIVLEARSQLTPATIVYGQGRCDMARHRDFLDETRGGYVCGFNPTGPVDPTVFVGRVASETGQPIATIVNYACHPTTLAWDNTLISPDYIGALREVVEGATHAPCLFIQGASGDIGPKHGFVGDVEVADKNGRQLGYATLAALESLPPAGKTYHYDKAVLSGATIGTWKYEPESPEHSNRTKTWIYDRVVLPLKYRADLPVHADLERERSQWQAEEQSAIAKNELDRATEAHAMIERATRRITRVESLPVGEAYPYPIIAWRIGDAIWIALDGEHYNVLQRTLRERFPDVPLVIGTIANGSKVWYLPDSGSFGLGLYQEEVSILAKGALEAVIESTAILIQKLIDRDK